MLHLIKYNLLVKLKNFSSTFWPLVFPILLGTMFYFAFGNIDDSDFQTVPVAVVQEEQKDTLFLMYLDQIENNSSSLLSVTELSSSEASDKLEKEEVAGIYFIGKQPSLTVASNGIQESILQSVLSSYETGRATIQDIARNHPEGLLKGIRQMLNTENTISSVSLGGRTINGNVQFFYALIAMGCLYGCFIGFGSAVSIQANITPLAARRCVTPTHKLKLILSEQIASFLLGYLDVIVLLFIGSLGKIREGIKIGIILGFSMVSSFLAGLMNNTMKDLVEKNAPIINRINPASLISDAFYCINVYDDMARYYRNLITLAVMSIVLAAASFLIIRRERYDSI